MNAADVDLGIHKARRRLFELDIEAGVSNVVLATGTFVDSTLLYLPAFSNCAVQVSAQSPAGTTIDVRIVPRITGSMSVFLPGVEVAEEFIVAPLAFPASGVPVRLCGYWGEARGLLTGALATGSTYVASPVFKLRLRNTGANVANLVSIDTVLGW